MRRLGERAQVNVELIDCESGSHIWADRFAAATWPWRRARSPAALPARSMPKSSGMRGAASSWRARPDADVRDLVMRGLALRLQRYSVGPEVRERELDLH